MDFNQFTNLSFGDEAETKGLIEPARTLVYGPSKARKTWWSGTAAEAGFNLTILDGENNTGILKQLSPDAQKRVSRIPVNQSATGSTMAAFLMLMLEYSQFIYCPATRKKMSSPSVLKDDQLYYAVDLSLFTINDVLLVDSWTQITRDVVEDFKNLHGLDPFEGKITVKTAKGSEDLFAFFNYCNLVLDPIASQLNSLPCNVIMTAHRDFYTHTIREGASKRDETHVQVLSTSGNQAAKVPAAFGDVIYATQANDGMTSTMSTKGSPTRISGGCRVAPAEHKFPPWGYGDYAKEAGLPKPTPRDPNTLPPICILTGAMIKELVG